MNTKKELSLNTQLTKLREVNNLLKLTVTPALYLDSTYGGNRGYMIQQFIYSLRDLQYKLRGLKIKVSRSAQVRKMTVSEIYDTITNQISQSQVDFNDTAEEYFSKLQNIQLLLNSVVQYCNLHKSLEDIEEDKDKKVVQNWLAQVDVLNLPTLSKSQIDILYDALIQRIESQVSVTVENNELY